MRGAELPKALERDFPRAGGDGSGGRACSRATSPPPPCQPSSAPSRTAQPPDACTSSTCTLPTPASTCAAAAFTQSLRRVSVRCSARASSPLASSRRTSWQRRSRPSAPNCRAGGSGSCWSICPTLTSASSRHSSRSRYASHCLICCAGPPAAGSSGSTNAPARTSRRRSRSPTSSTRSADGSCSGRASRRRCTAPTPSRSCPPLRPPRPSSRSTPTPGRCCARSTATARSPSWPASAGSRSTRLAKSSMRWSAPACSTSKKSCRGRSPPRLPAPLTRLGSPPDLPPCWRSLLRPRRRRGCAGPLGRWTSRLRL